MTTNYRTPPRPPKAAQQFIRAVAALVFLMVLILGVYLAIGGFTWGVRENGVVRLPLLIAGSALAAGAVAFLLTLPAGWREGLPLQYDHKRLISGFLMTIAGVALTFL